MYKYYGRETPARSLESEPGRGRAFYIVDSDGLDTRYRTAAPFHSSDVFAPSPPADAVSSSGEKRSGRNCRQSCSAKPNGISPGFGFGVLPRTQTTAVGIRGHVGPTRRIFEARNVRQKSSTWPDTFLGKPSSGRYGRGISARKLREFSKRGGSPTQRRLRANGLGSSGRRAISYGLSGRTKTN